MASKRKRMTDLEAIRYLRKEQPKGWGKFSEANLLRRLSEARKQRRELEHEIETTIEREQYRRYCAGERFLNSREMIRMAVRLEREGTGHESPQAQARPASEAGRTLQKRPPEKGSPAGS